MIRVAWHLMRVENEGHERGFSKGCRYLLQLQKLYVYSKPKYLVTVSISTTEIREEVQNVHSASQVLPYILRYVGARHPPNAPGK